MVAPAPERTYISKRERQMLKMIGKALRVSSDLPGDYDAIITAVVEELAGASIISASRAREIHGMSPEEQRQWWRERRLS